MTRMCPVVHFEMPAHDRARMTAFYQRVFGWKAEMLGAEMDNYVLVTTTDTDARPGAPAGAIGGGFFQARSDGPVNHPSVVIAVEDIAAAMQRVTEAGGEIPGEPQEIPGIGLHSYFRDTEGNVNSMLQATSTECGHTGS